MKVKRIITSVLSGCLVLGLTACGSSTEIAELNTIEAAHVEADVTEDYNLSYSEKQDMIYSQVADRQLLDLTSLTKCSDNELQEVINYMDAVDAQLVGTSSTAIDETIDSCFTDYLLCAFEETPYYWQRTQTIIRGIDAESRSIIVDVDYKTIGFEKTVQAPSAIPLGCAGYEIKLKNRYDRWIDILTTKYNQGSDSGWQQKYDEFVKYYGNFEDIYASQTNLSLTEQLYETGNQKTYEGMKDSEAEQSTGKMTVRYVLVPNYKLGINLGLTCQHMYILSYALDRDATSNLEIFTDEGYATVTDSVYNLIYSYFQCIDENNYTGLCSLVNDFGKIDKHYEELFETTYTKHENFTVSLFDIQGTHITCGIEVGVKKRAKGSKMTYPLYKDRYFCELELVEDKLKIANMVLLSTTLEGEPTIKTDEADVLGFANAIDLDNEDKQDIEKLICNFSALQLEKDTSSDNFSKVVDISISQSNMKNLTSAMTTLGGVKKVVWISNYQQGTSNYASVKCTELYQQSDNSIVEASAIYSFILKGDVWYVYDYDIVSSARLGTTNLNTAGCLCLISPGKIEQYTSQIKGTESNTATDTIVSDISVVYAHEEYTPKIKSGTVEQGLDTEQAYALSDSEYKETFDNFLTAIESEKTADEWILAKDTFLTDYEDYLSEHMTLDENDEYVLDGEYLELYDVTNYLDDMYKEIVATYYNRLNNRYEGDELANQIETLKTRWASQSKQISDSCKDSNELKDEYNEIQTFLNTAITRLDK